ncbi:MAG: hypothetical protein IT431_02765 [Phycisphaerales bacterium]|nr:hypothetical protein [Phycisphaerales bacterium]
MARTTRRTIGRLWMLGAAGLTLAGCTHEANDALRLGECAVLPAFQNNPHQLPPAGPSVTGLDRSNWEPMVYVIPVSGVAHSPQYAPPVFDRDILARQRGDFPTALTALELGEPDAGEELLLAARAHGWALLDMLMLVPRLAIRPPTATNWSPAISYGRSSIAVMECEGPAGEGCTEAGYACGPAPAACDGAACPDAHNAKAPTAATPADGAAPE